MHVEDCRRLNFVELEQGHEPGAGIFDGGRRANERDDIIECIKCLEVSAQDVGTLFCLAEAVARTALQDFDLMGDPVSDELLEGQGARHPIDEREHVRAEIVLELGVLVQLVQDDLGNRVTLQVDDEPHAGAGRGVIADIGDSGEFSLTDELGDAQEQIVWVDLVREFGDDQNLPAAGVLINRDDGAHRDRTAPGAEIVVDALASDNERAGREVGALDDAGERRLPSLTISVWIRQQPLGALGNLAEVVRGNVRCHPHGDAGAAIDEEVGESGRQHPGLLGAAVVVWPEVDGVLIDIPHHLHGKWRHTALGVALGRGRVVARGAEVALPLHEWVAQ